MKTIIMSYTIKRKAKSITFDVDAGFIIAFGFAIDPKSTYSNYTTRRYNIVIPFLVFEINVKKYHGR